MKKVTNSKKSLPKKAGKSDSGELRKPSKLTPLKDKEKKKNWKKSVANDDDEDLDAMPDEDIKFEDLAHGSIDDDEEEDRFFEDEF
ncbi:MAG: hypothetical protein ABI199_04705 [Bacteroidia bacterium]